MIATTGTLTRHSRETETERRLIRLDCLFLSLIVLAFALPFWKSLGFYSDDWQFLSSMTFCDNHTISGQWACLVSDSPETQLRPLQALGRYLMYNAFGLEPAGYHLVNSLIFCAAVVLLYLLLRQLNCSRVTSLCVALLFGSLPHYTADRFWIAAAEANLSIALCFLSFWAAAKASGALDRESSLWLSVSLVSMLGSAFTYEITVPLFIILPFILYVRLRRAPASLQKRVGRRFVWPLVAVAATWSVVFLFKAATRVTAHWQFRSLKHFWPITQHSLREYLYFNYGSFGLGLPWLAWRSLATWWNPRLAMISMAFLALTSLYFYSVVRSSPEKPELRPHSIALILSGTVVYWLGYVLFFLSGADFAGITGVDNRVTMAAAVGTALAMIGIFGLACSFVPMRFRRGLLCLVVGVYCAGGFVVVSTLGAFWAAASKEQHAVLNELRTRLPALDRGTVLLLDGVCPYAGPAVVFETDWDVTGALRILYRDPTLLGNVVDPNIKVLPDQIVRSFYDEQVSYPFSKNLILYHAGRHETCRLADAKAAQDCLEKGNFREGVCPASKAGRGVLIY
jgi:hypothetical protein